MLQQLHFVRQIHAQERETLAAIRAQFPSPERVPPCAPPALRCRLAASPERQAPDREAPRYPLPSLEAGVSHSVSPSKRTASSGA